MVILKNEDYARIFKEYAGVVNEFRELRSYLEVMAANNESIRQDIADGNFNVEEAYIESIATQADLVRRIMALDEKYTNLCKASLKADDNSKKIFW